MRIQSAVSAPRPFDPGVDSYYGPPDGLSRARRFPGVTGPAITAGVSVFCRVEVEGQENLPHTGAHVYVPNHLSVLDVPILMNLGVEDLRTMVNVDLFQYPILARLLMWGSAYPVDRVNPSPITREHTVNVVKEGRGLGIFGEGDFTLAGDLGRTGPFHKGPAAAAILGGAESLVPIGIHYGANDKPRYSEQAAGAVAAGAVIACGLLGSAHPVLGSAVGILGGILTGSYLGGLAGRSLVAEEEPSNPVPKLASTLLGAILGGGVAGLLSWSASDNPAAMLGCALAGGLSTLAQAAAWRNRPVAHVKIGPPIPLQPYLEQAKTDRKGAVLQLTRDLHERVGHLKQDLSGIPYDPDAPRVTNARPTLHWNKNVSFEELRQATTGERPGG